MSEPLDEELLARIMRSVKLEPRIPMRIRISKVIKGQSRDVHVMEVNSTDDIVTLQKEVISIARRWKGGFEVGTLYTVERLA